MDSQIKWTNSFETRTLHIVDWISPTGDIYCVGFFAPEDAELINNSAESTIARLHRANLGNDFGKTRTTTCLITVPTAEHWTC